MVKRGRPRKRRKAVVPDVVFNRPSWLYPKQLEAIYDSARYSAIEASTKSGKTVGSMCWLLEQGFKGQRGQNFWWISPIYRQSESVFRRVRNCLTREAYTANETKLVIELINGVRLHFLSGEKPDTLYGEDVFACVIDEASRTREEAWHAIRTTLTATKGPVRIIGNVRGRKNWFYRMARRAEAGEPEMAYHKLTWKDAVAAGVLDRREVEDAKRQLPDAVFRELYCVEASDDEGNPFGLEAIRACIVPMSGAEPMAWGWDLAKSQDYTVGVGLDAAGGVCRFYRFQIAWEETIQRIIRAVGTTAALVDSTGVGDPVVERLQRENGPSIEGYHFTSTSKQQLMEGLAVAIQSQEVSFPEGPIVSELETMEYEYTRTGVKYSAPAGMYDDCVCALALAVRKLSQPQPSWGFISMKPERAAPVEQRFHRIGRMW